MTREEAIQELEFAKAMCEFDPTTGEVGFRNAEDERQYEAFSMAIEALQAQVNLDDVSTAYENGYLQGKFEAQQWIPCSERLPEYADFYLTSTEHNSVYCDFYDGYRFQRTEKVIAWMPLPSPYKENES